MESLKKFKLKLANSRTLTLRSCAVCPPAGVGPGVPKGGQPGQVLAKASTQDYDTHWITVTGSGDGTVFTSYAEELKE